MPNIIETYRQENPQYKDIDDVTLANALYEKHYATQLDIDDFYGKVGIADQIGSEFTRGIKRGTETTKALITEGVPGVAKGLANDLADAFGYDEVAAPEENLKRYQEKVQQAQEKFPTDFPSFKDIHGVGDVGGFIAGALGEQIPQLGLSLMGGGIGGAATKQGIKALAKKQGTELTDKQVNKFMNRGILAGTLAPSGAQNIPETYFNLLSQGEDAGIQSVLVGGLKSGLDALPQISVLKKVLGPKAGDIVGDTLLKRITGEGLKAAAGEGVTEATQEGIDLIAEQFILENQELFTPENLTQLVDAGLKGAIGGGGMGAASAPFMNAETRFDYDSLSPKQKAKLDQEFTEDVIGKAANTGIVENKANPLDDSIVQPLYVPDETLVFADNLGVSKESVTLISPKEVETTKNALDSVLKATSLDEAFLMTPSIPEDVKTSLTARIGQIKDKQRTDTDFILGDGEIVSGAPLNLQEVTTTNPTSKLEVNNTRLLEQSVQPRIRADKAVNAKANKFQLPRDLKSAKPRYINSKLNFPSDVEKALYTVAGRKDKSKADERYLEWLREATGMTDPEIFQLGTALKNEIKQIHNQNQDLETINVPPVDLLPDPNFQRLDLPFNGNLRDDYIVPRVIHNNLKGIELSSLGKKQYKNIIDTTQRIVREVAGKGVRVLPFEQLQDFQNNPIAGAQFLNTITVAINETTAAKMDETAYHEAYHALENMGAFSEKELQVIDNNTTSLLNYLNDDDYLRGQDFQVLLSTPTGRQELRANAFGKWARENRLKSPSIAPSMFKSFFRKAQNMLERLGNALKGLGMNSMEDIFTSGLQGERTVDILDDINYTTRIARFQKIGEEFQEAHNEERRNEDPSAIAKQARIKSNELAPLRKSAFYTRWLRSMADAASSHPFLGEVYDSVRRRTNNGSALLENYINVLGDFTGQKKAVRHRLHELANFLRDTNQKSTLDEQGRLVFERDGKIVRLNDTELSRQYMQMQAGYREVLKDYSREIKRQAFKEFGPEVLVHPQFGITEVKAAREAFVGEDQKTVDRLDKLAESLQDMDNMGSKDFIPHMRFGSWGITVREKDTDNQVAFYTVEKGSFQGEYNKFQMEEMLGELKTKYSDTSKFEIVGDKGKIKDLTMENMRPFKLTHNTLTNNVDSRFLNLEFLSSLLSSKDLDVEAYEQFRQEIYNDILKRGFSKRFSEDKQIDGYSKDWNRVQHAYLSGAAHYLSGLPHQDEVAALRREAEQLRDDTIKNRAISYLNYTGSPQEDLVALRSFNFLWTMGGNLSTAALQLMTLPTTTLGSMTQYNPNVLQNMQLIGKWFAVGMKFAPSLFTDVTDEGVATLSFNNPAKIKKFLADGTLTQAQAKHIIDQHNEGKTRGLVTEEQAGSRQFEVRSKGGGVKAGLSTAANLLGLPITTMEQLTRFATTMATFDMLEGNPKAQQRARKVLKNDHRFQAQLRNEPDKSFVEHVAAFSMDEAHAVFGKLGRPEFMRHAGGALIFPFMTYPQQALEFMVRTLGRGKEGRRGAAVTVGALFMLSGLMGLPGGELLKELLEELEKQVTGSEEDFDLLIREKIYDATGSPKFAKFVTQGMGRSLWGMDVSRRIGLPIPGQELLLNMLGIRGDSSDLLGVSGSLLTGMGDAWNEYNNDSSLVKVASALMPVSAANMLKARNFTQEGVRTKRGVQLVTPEDVTFKTVASRALGITSDQIATKREELYLSQLLGTKHATAIERLRGRAKNIVTKLRRAQRNNNVKLAKRLQQDRLDVIMELRDYGIRNKIPVDIPAFNKSVNKAVVQRLDPTVKPKDIRKAGRKDLSHLQRVLGTKE